LFIGCFSFIVDITYKKQINMNKSLKVVNELVANADPNNYSSISYGKYYRDMTKISNSIIDEFALIQSQNMKIMAEINKLPESSTKNNLLALIQGIGPGGMTS